MTGHWVEPDIRDEIIDFVETVDRFSGLSQQWLIARLGIGRSRYYQWLKRTGQPNDHNGKIPKKHWILPEERARIVAYCRERLHEGYRRLTYMMLDDDVVAVSPSTTYRALKDAGLLNRWVSAPTSQRKGFKQPLKPHEHWHIDIMYVNILGTIYFLISTLDGASRFVVHHELRANMTEYDVQITARRAMEKFPGVSPRIISDNGPQFISKDFKEFIRLSGFTHVRTALHHPQSNGKLERFHGTVKQEEIRKTGYVSIEDARRRLAAYIEHYNTKRLHSAIHYLTPEDVLLGRTEERLRVRQGKLNRARMHRILMCSETSTSVPASVSATSTRSKDKNHA